MLIFKKRNSATTPKKVILRYCAQKGHKPPRDSFFLRISNQYTLLHKKARSDVTSKKTVLRSIAIFHGLGFVSLGRLIQRFFYVYHLPRLYCLSTWLITVFCSPVMVL
jgi:hypothetical protein